VRYQALMRSAGRCVLCGATKEETTLHVDHILPRSRGGKNTIDNLQVLCATCNEAKSNRDTTDLRAGLLVAETATDQGCPFCGPDLRSKAVARSELCFAVSHPRSPVAGHLLGCPSGTRPTSWLSPPTSGATARISSVLSATSLGVPTGV